MTRHASISILSVCLLAAAVLGVEAETESYQNLAAKPVHVAMFKNGLAVIVARAELGQGRGAYRLSPLPEATFGSLWISWPEGLELSDIRALTAERTEWVPAASIVDILEANIGRTLDILVQNQWRRMRIVDLPARPLPPGVPDRRPGVVVQRQPGNLLLLADAAGITAIPPSWVQQVRLDGQEPSLHVRRPTMEHLLQFTAEPVEGKPTPESPIVELSYLARGIAWAPSYVVDISEKDDATLSAKAIVVNDLTDLADVSVELVAGFPHLQFGHVPSPISPTSLNDLLNALRGRRPQSGLLDNVAVVMQQREQLESYAGERTGRPSMPVSPVMGQEAEDLYFYQLGDISLGKDERGYYPLFSAQVPYEHLYTWEIPDYIDVHERYRPEPDRAPEVVWHVLKLTNTTDRPWTTGPAMTTQDGRVLGQDTIHYTPATGRTELRITQAVSVHAEENEYEIARKRNAARFYNSDYDLVTVRGELAITNYKSQAVTVKITKTLSGEVTEVDGEPETAKLAHGLRRVNPRSQLTWHVEVKPGREHTVTLRYTYEVYVRG